MCSSALGIGVCLPDDVGYEPADSPFIGKCWREFGHFELTVFRKTRSLSMKGAFCAFASIIAEAKSFIIFLGPSLIHY